MKYQAFSMANEVIEEAMDKLGDVVYNDKAISENERVALKALVINMCDFLEMLHCDISEADRQELIYQIETETKEEY